MGLKLTGCILLEDLDTDPKRHHSWYAQRGEAGVGISVTRRVDLHRLEVVATMALLGDLFLPDREFPVVPFMDRVCRDFDAYLAQPVKK